MTAEPVFSPRLLIGWVAGAVAIFALSLYLMGAGNLTGTDNSGTSTYSRSAIGHAGIAEVLQRLGIPVVKSQYDSLEKLSAGSVLVIAEPRANRQSEEAIRTLLKANTILLVLPKWTGEPSEQTQGWLREVNQRFLGDAQWALRLVAPRAEVVRESFDADAKSVTDQSDTGKSSTGKDGDSKDGAGKDGDKPITWTTNALRLAPNVVSPIQLVRGAGLRPIIGGERGMLIGEIADRDRRIWVLSDPDVISNHGLARSGNAALAVALIKRLRRGEGGVVFDETVHGYLTKPESPFLLLFRFPFVVATAQGLLAVALLLWATMARFGAPQSAPAPLQAGRSGLLQNMARLIEFTGHQPVMITRYIQETVRDVARQLRAPRELTGEALIGWLQRVGTARGVAVDCGAVVRGADELGAARRRDLSPLIRLARDIHRWKGEILDGRSRHPRDG